MTTLPQAALPTPQQFHVDSEGSANSARWTEWIRRFKRYISAAQIKDDQVQIETLLICAGEAVEKIYFLNAKSTDKFKDVVDTIDAHFKPYADTDSNILVFRSLTQRPNKNIESFIIRLRAAAVNCEFTTRLDQELKLQVMTGSQSKRVREKGRSEKLTLAELIKFARTCEDMSNVAKLEDIGVKREAACALVGETDRAYHITQAKHGGQKSTTNSCQACGYDLPHKSQCPAIGGTCHNCGGKEHFSRMCKKPKKKRVETVKALTTLAQTQQDRQIILDELREVIKKEFQQNGDFYTTFSVHSKAKRPCPTIIATINGTKMTCGIDSQASINAMSLENNEKMDPNQN